MACAQQIRASCESDYSEKEKIVSKDSQGRVSSEHNKHGHKSTAYANEAGYQVVGGNGHQTCNSSPANKHSNHLGHSQGHLSLTEKVAGLFSSNKPHQGSGCNANGHQTSGHGSHGHIVPANGNQTTGHGSHGHVVPTHGHQITSHGGHGHNSSVCNRAGHSHHKVSRKESYEFEEKKEYKSCSTGRHKKVEKKVKKKSSYKSSSSDSDSDSESEKEHC